MAASLAGLIRRPFHLIASALARVDVLLARLARRKLLSCLLVALLPVVIRLAFLPSQPIPVPWVQDEYSYLLGAQTFAAGRLTNPPHPMWVHFESASNNLQPTYASKYPPAQSLFLAAGKVLFGREWFGVCLSIAWMCACLYWMLLQWLSPRYALTGALLAAAELGITSYWMNSYWGGAVAAGAGALLVGAVSRLARRPDFGGALAAGVSLAVLANSRPYEGLILAAGCIVGAVIFRKHVRKPIRAFLAPAVLAGLALVLVPAGLWMGYYNHRVTGHAFTFPYTLNQKMYGAAPLLIILPDRKVLPEYRHASLARGWLYWDRALYLEARRKPLKQILGLTAPFYDEYLPLFVPSSILIGLLLFASPFEAKRPYRRAAVLFLVLAAGVLMQRMVLAHYAAVKTPFASLVRSLAYHPLLQPTGPLFLLLLFVILTLGGRYRAVSVVLGIFGTGLLLEKYVVAHYWAPAIPIVCLLLALGYRRLAMTNSASRALATVLLLGVVVAQIVILHTTRVQKGDFHWALARGSLVQGLESRMGRHLVIVRYTDNSENDRTWATRHHEWVNNEADIDAARIVWAEDMGEAGNRELLDYFSDRQAWLLLPDEIPLRLIPYPQAPERSGSTAARCILARHVKPGQRASGAK